MSRTYLSQSSEFGSNRHVMNATEGRGCETDRFHFFSAKKAPSKSRLPSDGDTNFNKKLKQYLRLHSDQKLLMSRLKYCMDQKLMKKYFLHSNKEQFQNYYEFQLKDKARRMQQSRSSRSLAKQVRQVTTSRGHNVGRQFIQINKLINESSRAAQFIPKKRKEKHLPFGEQTKRSKLMQLLKQSEAVSRRVIEMNLKGEFDFSKLINLEGEPFLRTD